MFEPLGPQTRIPFILSALVTKIFKKAQKPATRANPRTTDIRAPVFRFSAGDHSSNLVVNKKHPLRSGFDSQFFAWERCRQTLGLQ